MTISESVWKKIILGVSAVVTLLVALMFFVQPPDIAHGINLAFFPKFHAVLNSIATVLLVSGFIFIKNRKITAHKVCMALAFAVSAVFLVSYVTYHTLSAPTPYGGDGILKFVYFFILLTHIILAASVLPFILFTFFRALTGDYYKHKKVARITLPIWLYVTVTGVLVYLLISPYY